MTIFTGMTRKVILHNAGAAYKVTEYSPVQVSQALVVGRVSHLICAPVAESVFRTRRVRSRDPERAYRPVVCTGLDSAFKYKPILSTHLLLICGGPSVLDLTDLPSLPGAGETLSTRLRLALDLEETGAPVSLEIREPGLTHYIDKASRPSLLRDLQTLFYKITPYALRKEIQHSVLLYLGGGLLLRELNLVLDKHHHGPALRKALREPGSQILLKALRAVRSGAPAQEVADELDLDVFDINYILATTRQKGGTDAEKNTPDNGPGKGRRGRRG